MLPILTGDRGTMPMQKLQVSRWNRNRPPAFPTPMATCCHQFGHSLWLSLLPHHCQLCIWMLRILCYDAGNLLLVLQGSTPRSLPALPEVAASTAASTAMPRSPLQRHNSSSLGHPPAELPSTATSLGPGALHHPSFCTYASQEQRGDSICSYGSHKHHGYTGILSSVSVYWNCCLLLVRCVLFPLAAQAKDSCFKGARGN